jgi:tRNA modification GTPase
MSAPRETIAAVATAQGPGWCRDRSNFRAARRHCRYKRSVHASSNRVMPITGLFGENLEVLDEGIALYFPGPNSFTGEDVLELQGHGGPIVLDMLLQRCIAAGLPAGTAWGIQRARVFE